MYRAPPSLEDTGSMPFIDLSKPRYECSEGLALAHNDRPSTAACAHWFRSDELVVELCDICVFSGGCAVTVHPVTFRAGPGMRPGLLLLERLTLIGGCVIYKWKKNKLAYRSADGVPDRRYGISSSATATSSTHAENAGKVQAQA